MNMLTRILKYFGEFSYFLLRAAAGFLFACHGVQKLFGLLGGKQASEPLMIVAGLVEIVGGSLIAVGLLTEFAAVLCMGQMAVAYYMSHLPKGLWPIQNGGELALLYLVIFFFVATTGAGRISFDHALKGGGGSGKKGKQV